MKKKAKICRYCIVKRHGHQEEFDERKVYASCYAACLSTHMQQREAEDICSKISKTIKGWIKSKKVVNSGQIFKQIVKELKQYNKDAAFMYETHRDIS